MTTTHAPEAPRTGRAAGIALMVASPLSNQTGAAVGSLAFPVITPAGVVAVRQWIAAVVLLAVTRPRWRGFTTAQWRLIAALAVVFAVINLALYSAVDRIGLGLAVTLEFLGPLTVALAGSRRRIDLGCALLAGAGVAVLMRPQPSTDYLGMGLALLAAVCWGCYILLNHRLGRSLPGAQGTATACGLSGLVYIPLGIAVLLAHPPTTTAVVCAVTAGVASSAVPFLFDALALRRVPAPLFAICMSLNPALAATTGLLILDQHLAPPNGCRSRPSWSPTPPRSSPAADGGRAAARSDHELERPALDDQRVLEVDDDLAAREQVRPSRDPRADLNAARSPGGRVGCARKWLLRSAQ